MEKTSTATVLVIDDEEVIRFAFQTHLRKADYRVMTAADYAAAIDIITSRAVDVIITDIILEGHSGIDLLKAVKKLDLNCPVVMITGEPNLETATDAVRLGAFDYLPKPVHRPMLLNTIRLAVQHKQLMDEKERYQRNLAAIFSSMSDAVITVDNAMRILAANDAVNAILEVPALEMAGHHLNDITFPCRGQCLEILEQTVRAQKPVKAHRVEARSRSGARRVLVLTTSLLAYSGGQPSGAVLVIRDITRINDLERELHQRHRFHNIIGKSNAMQKVYDLMQDLAETESTVLITGESGVGKELAARALHYEGLRADKPFVVANCSAFADNLLESELFGHVRGAFTGAVKNKIGRFQRAEGGTLFIDEVGDISPLIQLKLLRVLQEKEIEKVGGTSTTKVDVRIIAATHRNLKQMVARGTFRRDLYYRIKVVEVNLPPLRNRYEDIPLLVDHICRKLSHKMKTLISGADQISQQVMDTFMRYLWPGNVRELENILEHALVVCHSEIITVKHLPPDFARGTAKSTDFRIQNEPVAEAEMTRQTILQALDKTDWNKAKAARLLGISRRTIYRKLHRLKLRRPS